MHYWLGVGTSLKFKVLSSGLRSERFSEFVYDYSPPNVEDFSLQLLTEGDAEPDSVRSNVTTGLYLQGSNILDLFKCFYVNSNNVFV